MVSLADVFTQIDEDFFWTTFSTENSRKGIVFIWNDENNI